jgi:hypothetical protein
MKSIIIVDPCSTCQCEQLCRLTHPTISQCAHAASTPTSRSPRPSTKRCSTARRAQPFWFVHRSSPLLSSHGQVRPGVYLEHLVIRGSVNLIACGPALHVSHSLTDSCLEGSSCSDDGTQRGRSVVIKSQRHTALLCVGSSCTATFRGFEFQSDALNSMI